MRKSPRPTQKEAKVAGKRMSSLGADRYESQIRGNTSDRRASKRRLLAEFGDGHSCGCVYCGLRLTENTLTRDKIYTAREGGRYRHENLVPACTSCNQARGDLSWTKIKWPELVGNAKVSLAIRVPYSTGQMVRARTYSDPDGLFESQDVEGALLVHSVETLGYVQYLIGNRPVIPATIQNLTDNAFCPTGPGGGIDPTCSPLPKGLSNVEENRVIKWEKVGRYYVNSKPLVLYHGTTASRASDILAGGLKYGNLTLKRSYAEEIARIRREGERPVVFEVRVPAGSVHPVWHGPKGTRTDALSLAKPISPTNLRQLELTDNAFCPTGEGGGVDPSCSPGAGKGKAKQGTYHIYFKADYDRPEDETRRIKVKAPSAYSAIKGFRKRYGRVTFVDLKVLNSLSVSNVFCPTGKGGGIDPTCSPGHKTISVFGKTCRLKKVDKIPEGIMPLGGEAIAQYDPETKSVLYTEKAESHSGLNLDVLGWNA